MSEKAEVALCARVVGGAADPGARLAVREALAVLACDDRIFVGRQDRVEQEVLVLVDHPELGGLERPAEKSRSAERRGEKARFPVYRRLGMAEIGGVGDGEGEKNEVGVGIMDPMVPRNVDYTPPHIKQ